jgi:hypothetical protein
MPSVASAEILAFHTELRRGLTRLFPLHDERRWIRRW